MKSYLDNDTIFCIVPADFDNCAYIKFFEQVSDRLVYKTDNDVKLGIGETAEFFANGQKGVLYFCSKIINVKNNFIEIEKPKTHEIIQRRENERVKIKQKIRLKDETENLIDVMLCDLSVGGMKIISENELKSNCTYKVYFDFDNSCLEFSFIPTRVNNEAGKYIVSGQIDSPVSANKIELVQYCYKKLFEQSNRN